jgi:hypothetical protein
MGAACHADAATDRERCTAMGAPNVALLMLMQQQRRDQGTPAHLVCSCQHSCTALKPTWICMKFEMQNVAHVHSSKGRSIQLFGPPARTWFLRVVMELSSHSHYSPSTHHCCRFRNNHCNHLSTMHISMLVTAPLLLYLFLLKSFDFLLTLQFDHGPMFNSTDLLCSCPCHVSLLLDPCNR